MSLNGKVSVWRLPPDKFDQVLQNPDMDLGKPDEIEYPESMLKAVKKPAPRLGTQKRKQLGKVGGTKQAKLTREQFEDYCKEGLSKDQICERTNITIGRLRYLIRRWEQGEETSG